MADINIVLTVTDDGSVVLKNFEKNAESMKDALDGMYADDETKRRLRATNVARAQQEEQNGWKKAKDEAIKAADQTGTALGRALGAVTDVFGKMKRGVADFLSQFKFLIPVFGALISMVVAWKALVVSAMSTSIAMAERFGRSILGITERFQDYRITLMGALKDKAAVEELLSWALRYADKLPITFDKLMTSIKSFALIPTLKPLVSDTKNLDKNLKGLIETAIGLATMNPQRGIEGALNAIRNAVTGNMRSLQFGFDILPQTIAASVGKTVAEIKKTPQAMLEALKKFTSLNVGAEAIEQSSRKFSVQFEGMSDILQQMAIKVGESGFYERAKDRAIEMIEWFGKLRDSTEWVSNWSIRLSNAFTRGFDAIIESAIKASTILGEAMPGLWEFFKGDKLKIGTELFTRWIEAVASGLERIPGLIGKYGGTLVHYFHTFMKVMDALWVVTKLAGSGLITLADKILGYMPTWEDFMKLINFGVASFKEWIGSLAVAAGELPGIGTQLRNFLLTMGGIKDEWDALAKNKNKGVFGDAVVTEVPTSFMGRLFNELGRKQASPGSKETVLPSELKETDPVEFMQSLTSAAETAKGVLRGFVPVTEGAGSGLGKIGSAISSIIGKIGPLKDLRWYTGLLEKGPVTWDILENKLGTMEGQFTMMEEKMASIQKKWSALNDPRHTMKDAVEDRQTLMTQWMNFQELEKGFWDEFGGRLNESQFAFLDKRFTEAQKKFDKWRIILDTESAEKEAKLYSDQEKFLASTAGGLQAIKTVPIQQKLDMWQMVIDLQKKSAYYEEIYNEIVLENLNVEEKRAKEVSTEIMKQKLTQIEAEDRWRRLQLQAEGDYLASVRLGYQQWLAEQKNGYQEMVEVSKKSFSIMSESGSKMFVSAIKGDTKSIKELWSNMVNDMEVEYLQAIGRMMMKKLALMMFGTSIEDMAKGFVSKLFGQVLMPSGGSEKLGFGSEGVKGWTPGEGMGQLSDVSLTPPSALTEGGGLSAPAATDFNLPDYQIPTYASGGYVEKPQLAIVGEVPEIITPVSKLQRAAEKQEITIELNVLNVLDQKLIPSMMSGSDGRDVIVNQIGKDSLRGGRSRKVLRTVGR